MVDELLVVYTQNTVPYGNIAREKLLLDHVEPGQCILYLWQNARTVVIGRNQDALAEVRVAELEADGGHLARRLSGGGAVYHDLGNLNFTFVASNEDYDVDQQNEVILRAVRALGIPAERTGRNDLTAGGCKFSGHAYYRTGGASYHHGTLMVDVDVDDMGRYLKPAPSKLASKGVQSVRSRVANLVEFQPVLSIEDLAECLCVSFGQTFGLPFKMAGDEVFDAAELEELAGRFASREWLFRDERAFTRKVDARFGWGGVTLRYELEDEGGAGGDDAGVAAATGSAEEMGTEATGVGVIGGCALDSDGLEADYLAEVPVLLAGCVAEPGAIEAVLAEAAESEGQRAIARDIASLFGGQHGGD